MSGNPALHCKIEKSEDDSRRTYLQVTQKMQLLKRGKRSDACLRRFHVVTAFDSGLPDAR